MFFVFFFFQAEDGIRDKLVTGVQTCALPISIEPDADCCTLFVPAHPATRMSEAEVRAVEARLDIPRLVAQGTAGAVTETFEFSARGRGAVAEGVERSAESRVGKECRARWAPDYLKKKKASGGSYDMR